MNWIKNILKFGIGFTIGFIIWNYVKPTCPEQKPKVSLYNPVDTMKCRYTRFIGNRASIHDGFMIFVCVDSSNTKAFVVDSAFNEVDCNTLIEIDIKQ